MTFDHLFAEGARPRGTTIIDALWKAARAHDKDLVAFIAPLSSQPTKWLRQLREAKNPTAATLERVKALLEGREVPQLATAAPSVKRGRPIHAEIIAKGELERRRQLAERAAAERLPGETLHDAVTRLARAA